MRTSTMMAIDARKDTNTPRPAFPRSMKQYFSSFTKTTSTPNSRRSSQISSSGFSTLSTSSAPPPYEASQAATARWMAVWDAEEYIRTFINEQWSNNADHIKADCIITVDELHALGQLPQAEGSRACGRLLRAPVIHEEVALSLWERLAAEARRIPEPVVDNSQVEEANSVRTTSSVHSSTSSIRETAKKFLQKMTIKAGNDQPPHPAHTTLPTCPLCSGSCLDTSVAIIHPPTQPHQQQEWEEGFWQREEPPKYTPRSAAMGQERSNVSNAEARSKNPSNTEDGTGGSNSRRSKSAWLRRKREQVSATSQLLSGGRDSNAVLIWSSAGSCETKRAKVKEEGSSAWGRWLQKPRDVCLVGVAGCDGLMIRRWWCTK